MCEPYDGSPYCKFSHQCIGYLSAAAANRPVTPEVFKLILTNPERDQWMLAMKDEIESLCAHGPGVLTSVPPRQRIPSGRWLFVKKMGLTGLVELYKARFVVKGFLQRHICSAAGY